VSGAGHEGEGKWTFGTRVIPGAVRRATSRATLTYRFIPTLSGGIEVDPRAEEAAGKASPLVNWLAFRETGRRPALILGTSSDRIGTDKGQSYYATLSKNLKPETRLPIAPYGGISYGTAEHRWLPVAGLNAQLGSGFSSTVLFDGVRMHLLAGYARGRHAISFVLAYFNKPGFSYSISF
jgi:hypothetical protein